MKHKPRSFTLADAAVPGHTSLGKIGTITDAAKAWARAHPNPFNLGAGRPKRGGRK